LTDQKETVGQEVNAIGAIFSAITEAEAPADDLKLAKEPRNDLGNARRLITREGDDMIYVDGAGWYIWDDRRWSGQGGEPEAMKRAHRVAEAIGLETKALETAYDRLCKDPPADFIPLEWAKKIESHFKWQSASGNSAKVDAMLKTAMPYLRRLAREMDDRAFYVNVGNGTLELPVDVVAKEDGTRELVNGDIVLRPHRRGDLLTRLCNVTYDPEARCPLWEKFLGDVMPDKETQVFLQAWFGYVLTGDVSEQQLVMAYGAGANGKSTMLDVIKYIMGDYAIVLPIETFLSDDRKRGSEATPDIARVPGSRLVLANEAPSGRSLSESTVKQVTGGEEMTARHLHESFFEFMPCFKLVLSFNQKPRVRGQDEGIWRRILMVPFDQFIPKEKRDKLLTTKLKAEASGILNWMLDGYRIWRERGLVAPESVLHATDEYRSESDSVGEFMRAATRRMKGQRIQANKLFEIYTKWAGVNGLSPISRTGFGRRVSDLHYDKEKIGVMFYVDLEFVEEEVGGLEGSGSGSRGDPRPDDGGLPDETR